MVKKPSAAASSPARSGTTCMPGGVRPDQVAYYVELLKKVQQTPEWKQLMEQGAFNTTSLEGKEYADWVSREEARHLALMKTAKFIHGQ